MPDSAEPLVDAGRLWALAQIQSKRKDDYKNSLLMHMVAQHEAAPAHVQSFGEVMDRTEKIDPFSSRSLYILNESIASSLNVAFPQAKRFTRISIAASGGAAQAPLLSHGQQPCIGPVQKRKRYAAGKTCRVRMPPDEYQERHHAYKDS